MKFIFLLLLLFNSYLFFAETGYASWYGPNFHGKLTANGEKFNTYSLTAAHRTLPFDSIVKVTSLTDSKSIIVRINDRGPFAKGRIIDLSKAAMVKLDGLKKGTVKVRLEVISYGKNKYYRYNGKKYTIQIASLTNFANANEKVALLNQKEIPARIETAYVKGKSVYRIVVPNLTYLLYQRHRVNLHNAGYNSYLVREH